MKTYKKSSQYLVFLVKSVVDVFSNKAFVIKNPLKRTDYGR